MNKLGPVRRSQVVAALVEGNSIRAIADHVWSLDEIIALLDSN